MSAGVQVQNNMERPVLEQAQAQRVKMLGQNPNDAFHWVEYTGNVFGL